MHADFRMMLCKLIGLLGAVGSVEAFYIPGEFATPRPSVTRLTACNR